MLQQADPITVNDSVVPAAIADTIVVQQQDVNLLPYDSGTFFSEDTLSYAEVCLPGVAGESVPYTMRGDDILVCLVLFCFITTTSVFANSGHAIFHQLKEFFYIPRIEYADANMLPGKLTLFILNLQTCLLFGIAYYFYTTHDVAAYDVLGSSYELMAVYFGVLVAYSLLKGIIYQMVNAVFFESKKNKQMVWTLVFIAALEGIAFFPIIILQIYFGLSVQTVAYCFVFILVIAKLMTFYKCWAIFFRQVGIFLQIILYLCALEIVPLLILGGVLVTITNELKVIF